VLSTRGVEEHTTFYSYLACFMNIEYVHIHVMYIVNRAEYGIRILVAAPRNM